MALETATAMILYVTTKQTTCHLQASSHQTLVVQIYTSEPTLVQNILSDLWRNPFLAGSECQTLLLPPQGSLKTHQLSLG